MFNNENTNANPASTIFVIRDTKLYILITLSLYLQKIIKKYQNSLAKDLKGENKIRVRIKIQQMTVDIFSNKRWELTGCLLWFIQTKQMMQKV